MDWRESIKRIQNAQDNNQLVIFVGAGVSKNSNLPSWNDLIVAIASEVKYRKCAIPCKDCHEIDCNQKKQYTQDEYLQIPEYLYLKGESKYYKFIQDKLQSDKGPNPIDEEIYKILPHHIITTNYDHLLEDCKDINAKLYTVVSKDSDLLSKSNEKYIIKMHGDLQEPENIVLRESDYIEYEQKRPLISTYIRSLLINHTFVFIGYSLNDYNLKLIMGWINYYSKIYKVKERPYNFLITSDKTDSNEKRRLEKQRIYPINLKSIPKKVVESAKVPSVLSYPTAQRLYAYLRCITNIELLYKGMDKLEAMLEKLNSLKSYRKIAFDDLSNVLNCGYIDFESATMIFYDKSWYQFIFEAIEQNKELCAFFQKANINKIRYYSSDSYRTIPFFKDNLDKEGDLSLNFNYSELNDIIDNCTDISKKIYYYCWLNRDMSDIEALCNKVELTNDFIDYIDILLFKIRDFFATISIDKNQYEKRNEIKYLLNNVPTKYIKSIKFLKKLFESSADDLYKMDILLEEQNKRYKVNSNTTYSGHAFSTLWKLQSYAYNYYFFFKANCIPINDFSSTKNYFKYYIKSILCTYSPGTEFNNNPRAFFATHREHYPINNYDLDIIVKYCDPKLLKQWIKEYSVQTLEQETNLNIAEKIENLCNWCINVRERKWLKQLECLMIVYNLIKHSDDEEKDVFKSIIKICEKVFDLDIMYSAELYEIFYDFIMNYKYKDDYAIYDRFAWLIVGSKSSIFIRERFTLKTRNLIKELSNYVSENLKNKVLSYLLSIEDNKEKMDRICIAYQMYSCDTVKEIIESNYGIMEFVDIFNMLIDGYIILSDDIKKRVLNEISKHFESEVPGVIIQNNTGYYEQLLNYCIIMYLLNMDFDLKLLEKYKDYSDTVCFVLDPDSFDYSKVDFNDYMWFNLVYSEKYQKYFVEHKNEILSDKLKRVFELGIENREQQKIVYGILLNNEELIKF